MQCNTHHKRVSYRNGESFAVHKIVIRAAFTDGPNDVGSITQGPTLRVFPTLNKAAEFADACRAKHGSDETTGWSVTQRWHDARGKIVDQEQDVYIG